MATIACKDIREVELRSLTENIDVVIGGPPCQSFSASGGRAGGAAGRLDFRGNLFKGNMGGYFTPQTNNLRISKCAQNISTNKGKDWENTLASFSKLEYRTDYRLLDAAEFGAPQHSMSGALG